MTARNDASTPSGTPRVAIVGAGVCGLGIGWRLAQAGCAVTAFDRGAAGQGATWAAAGMLAAGVETEPGEEALLALTRHSQALWPDFARELTEAGGIDPEYRDEGTMVVALTRDDAEQLRFTYEFQRGLGIDIEWLTGSEARRREPHLKPGLAGAVFSPKDHQVDNRHLARGLKAAFERAGGQVREHCAVRAVETHGGRATGVTTDAGPHEADVVVLAAGARSRGLDGLPPQALPPVRPVKGQMLALRMDPRMPLLDHVLWIPGGYMVPRRDGRLLIGATVEERGFESDLTAGGLYALLDAAWRALPAIEELPIAETWVGHRPTSRDDAPILGPAGLDGLVVATGHHRNGILLAPVTADAVSRLILTGATPPEIAAFGMARFQTPDAPVGTSPVDIFPVGTSPGGTSWGTAGAGS